MRLTLWASLWLATLGNLSLWRKMLGLAEVGGWQGAWLVLCTGVMVAALCYALIALFAYRWLHPIVVSLLLVAAAFGSYYMWTYGVVLDTPMMRNVLHTDQREAADLLGWPLVLFVGVMGVLPAAWVWTWRQKVRYASVWRQTLRNGLTSVLALLAAVGSVLACFQTFSSVHRNHMEVRSLINPLSALYALGEMATEPLWGKHGPIEPIGADAVVVPTSPSQRPPLLVLVVGETARSGNFSINGYGRQTTPSLEALQKTAFLFSHPNAWACGTSTEASLPCMFSHLGREGYESSVQRFENLLDVLQRAGLAVLWVDNQSGCKGLCDRVASHQLSGEDLDVTLLQHLDERIARLSQAARQQGVVVVLHQMGSHGPAYYKRSDAARKAFAPECVSQTLSHCSQEALTNAYDNSIRYTDYFLGQTVSWLQAHSTIEGITYSPAMLYVADHGESLGEGNLYLHGLPYAFAPDVQKRVPWIVWFSGDYAKMHSINGACVQQNQAHTRLSHDHYFHTVLGLSQVTTVLYNPALDAYKACRSKP